jgi:Fic family protein
VGQIALQQALAPKLPEPAVQSFAGAGGRRTVEGEGHIREYYPAQYATDGSPLENLRFALKHEPLDLRIIHAALAALGPPTLEAWVRREPTGAYSRRAWFLSEHLAGRTLDLEAVRTGNYVDALDPKRHFTAGPIPSPRHRVRDNLLGGPGLCPGVRRTAKLASLVQADWSREAEALVARYDPDVLARAVRFLYTKETRSSFALEGESPSPSREERFLQALREASRFLPANKAALIALQNAIVDPRYAARDWRDFQNFVGETTRRFGEYVHFIAPRPEDVSSLMEGWLTLTERLRASVLDSVIAAAASSFAFVFVHPFEDGNGRIHRFVIHAMLAAKGFSPPGILFPVSAAILRQRHLYDRALEAFSRAVMPAIEWDFVEDRAIRVNNDTLDLYRFFDATVQAEFLYERVAETIRIDLKEEADFVEVFDAAFQAVREVVDMPDRRASLLIRLCLQNGGRLSQNKRRQFDELREEEFARIEAALQRILRAHALESL